MPIPVSIPGTPLPASDTEIARAEQLLAAIVQVVARGSDGATLNTPPTYVPDSPNNPETPIPLALNSPELQLGYRQLAVALAVWEGTPAPPVLPPPTDYSFNGTCLSSAQLGDLVYMTGGPGNEVRAVDITDFAKLPAIGCIQSKPTPTTCVVQTNNIITGVYSGLTPGKTHFVGSGANPKPVYPAPVPGVGQSLFCQPIGIAVTSTILVLLPNLGLTLKYG